MEFNSAPSKILLIDINSCFATIEQQTNPFLRGKPIAVVAYTTPNGTILAASIEAKKLGIKTGMRVLEARNIYPKIITLLPDPPKYRFVHKKLHKLLLSYSPFVEPKSIDEFAMEIIDHRVDPCDIAQEVKMRIKTEIGEWISVSIGIAPNRYLAKIAAGLVKPDGLVEINRNNYLEIYKNLKLKDLTGVKEGNERRFRRLGIYTIMDLYNHKKPIYGSYWYLRLRGYEVDNVEFKRKSFGNEVAVKTTKDLNPLPIIARLFDKANFRARKAGFRAKRNFINISGYKVSVTLFDLVSNSNLQLDFFNENLKKENIEKAVYDINSKWGNFVIGSARGFMAKDAVKDRISFRNLQ